jgi:hypothetical protein
VKWRDECIERCEGKWGVFSEKYKNHEFYELERFQTECRVEMNRIIAKMSANERR